MEDNKQNIDLGKHISILYRYGRSYMEQDLSEANLGTGQYSFLFYLYNNDGAIQDEISTSLSVDKATTTRAIQKLEKTGYVRREKDTLDQRMNRVYLTETGWALKDKLRLSSTNWENILLNNLSKEEVQNLNIIMQKLTRNAIENRQIYSNTGGKNVK